MRVNERKIVFAVGMSVLVHLILLQWHIHWQASTQGATQKPFEVVLHLVAPSVPTPVPSKPPAPTPAPKHSVEMRTAVSNPRPTVAPAAATPPPPAEATLPPLSEPSLLERARSQIKDVDRAMRDEDQRGPWMVKPKPLPPSLAKLPEEAKTALQKSFEDHLGEEVVLDVHEHQEGNNRVTMIHTNKGRYCWYEPLISHTYMGNMPPVARFGSCGPQS
jgi:hypothetical protein